MKKYTITFLNCKITGTTENIMELLGLASMEELLQEDLFTPRQKKSIEKENVQLEK